MYVGGAIRHTQNRSVDAVAGFTRYTITTFYSTLIIVCHIDSFTGQEVQQVQVQICLVDHEYAKTHNLSCIMSPFAAVR